MLDLIESNVEIWIPLFVVAIAILVVLRRLLFRLGISVPASAKTWESYLRGQGSILFLFLFLGIVAGWLAITLGRDQIETANAIRLIEYRQLNIAEHPAYEELDLDGYRRISVYAIALSPQASKLKIRVVPGESKPTEMNSVAFESGDSSWSKLEELISVKHVTLVIGSDQPNATNASQADVLVFLSKH